MSKEQIVMDAKVAFAQGQDELLSNVLGDVFDKAQAEVPPVDGGPSEAEIQARIDAAVEAKRLEDEQLLADQKILDDAALAEQKRLDDEALAAVKAECDMKMTELQGKFDELASKELGESALIDGLKGSIDGLKDVLAKLQAIFPAPVEPPVEG